MNWRRGLIRLWIVASVSWAGFIFLYNGWYGFDEPDSELEFLGVSDLPYWANRDGTLHIKHPFANRAVEELPVGHIFGEAPSGATILARIENTFIEAASPPAVVLAIGLIAYWIATGFRRNSN